jgi:hypothetical protein
MSLRSLMEARWPRDYRQFDQEWIMLCPSCEKADVHHYLDWDKVHCDFGCPSAHVIAAFEQMPEVGSEPHTTESDHRVPDRQEVDRAVHQMLVREQALAEVAEIKAADQAPEWFGITGDVFDPDTPEPMPCVLEYAQGRFAFAPGVVFLFGPRSTLKTWIGYLAVVQEVKRGNRALIVDYELSYEEAMRRLLVLGASREECSRAVYVHPSGALSNAGRAWLLRRFTNQPPTVVVVDSMGMGMGLSGLNANDDTESTQWAFEVPLWMKSQWREAVILLIDHVPKGSGTSAVDPIGSQRKGAYADGLYLATVLSPITRERRGNGRIVLRKDRKGLSEENMPLLDYEFGGGGLFVLSAPDMKVVSVDLSQEPDQGQEMTRIARYVGENEGATVEQARNDLGIRPNVFTGLKDALVDQQVIVHVSRSGLTKGERWQEFVDGPARA